MRKALKAVYWIIGILAILFVALVIARIPAVNQQKKSAETVAKIKATRLAEKDVDGSNLPQKPDPKSADATVEGIDANDNGIRDDVELAIFEKYPNNKKIRAAELQYALTLQLFLSSVTDQATWKAVAEANNRAYQCIAQATSAAKEAKNLDNTILNTSLRKNKYQNVFDNQVGFGIPDGAVCDINA